MQQPKPDRISLAEFLVWEQQQEKRYEWDDGDIIECRGGSDDHAAIITNMTLAIGNALAEDGPCFVRIGSERRLVPRDAQGTDLGSGYCDVFVSCTQEDQTENDAHFPTLVIEVLSPKGGNEFTSKKRAYLGSRDIQEYFIIESENRSVHHFYWTANRRLVSMEYTQGPITIRSMNLMISFDHIYRGTRNVKTVLRSVYTEQENVADKDSL
jgi:Uma2 family endonuclease